MTIRQPLTALVTAAILVTTACSGAQGSDGGSETGSHPDASDAPSPTEPELPNAEAVIREVPVEQWEEMVAVGMWREGCPATREDLRRVEINHVDFDGEVQRGVLVVNQDIADSVVRVFTRLFEEGFPIRRMRPVEEYDGDNNASMADDNTAAYNCRRPDQINAPQAESPHANGRAIDINPLANPWMDLRCDCWSPGPEFAERTEGRGRSSKAAWSGGPSPTRAGSGRTSTSPTTCTSTPATPRAPSPRRPRSGTGRPWRTRRPGRARRPRPTLPPRKGERCH